jgi:aspartyl-tRNA(Asn)/glutamyl-tRNA(Gln) amidotransferase subunit A
MASRWRTRTFFCRAGRISAGGSKIRADHAADETATVLQRLDRAGAIDLGTLHMAEFALSPTGYEARLGESIRGHLRARMKAVPQC